MATITEAWRVRSEDGEGECRTVDFGVLSQGVSDGVWSEADQVQGPGESRWMPVGDHPRLQDSLPPQPAFVSKGSEEAEMDMTPMIDVTFQLIIFFMITATFVVQKTLDMPETTADQQTPARLPTLSELQAENVIVKVRGDGTIEVDDRPVPIDQLAGALTEASKKNPDNMELILDVDDQVEYDVVVRVIDGAAGADMERVHFLRRASGGDPGTG